jgi:DNA-binding Lrp family transcriptional regulator
MGDDTSSHNRETVTDRDLLDTFLQTESPVIPTSEIAEAEEISISQGQVLKRLKSLEKKGRVGSKSFSAKPQIRLWWHKRLEAKEAWTSGNDFTEDVGVEAVDMLNLPGSGEKLRKRREAVSAVFKFLFDVETASKNELSLVGWGADMETYADIDSLWNNCLIKALGQSPLFVLYKSEKEWRLTHLGSNFKDIHNRPLWEDWEENMALTEYRYHYTIWRSVFESRFAVEFRNEGFRSWINHKYGEYQTEIGYILEMEGPAWFTPTGSFVVILEIREDQEDLERILDHTDHLMSELATDSHVEDFTGDGSAVQIRCPYQFEIDTSAVFRQLYNGMFSERFLIRPLKKLHRWEKETRAQLLGVDEKVNQLIRSS